MAIVRDSDYVSNQPNQASMTLATERFFGPDTPLRRAAEVGGREYEERPQQRQMAVEVAHHLEDNRHLLIEAPTGVGKTFAYLVPAIHYALERKAPVVVSTHTISLQEQILDKDVPVLHELLGVEFRAAVAKGRSNYLCLRRLNMLAEIDQALLPGAAVTEIDQICTWARHSEEGTLGDFGSVPGEGIWEGVCCERGNCLNGSHRQKSRRACGPRARSRRARLIGSGARLGVEPPRRSGAFLGRLARLPRRSGKSRTDAPY